MKALILKDFYAVIRQLKIIIVLLLVFACIPGYSVSGFAIVYVSMIPMTALAYDERSKWNTMAAMMPYSTNKIVLSKYVEGYALCLIASIFSVVAQLVVGYVKHTPVLPESLLEVFGVLCAGILIIAITFPFLFKLGVEKGRLAFIVLFFAVFMSVMAVRNTAFELPSVNLKIVGIVFVTFTIILSIISMLLSIKFYKNK